MSDRRTILVVDRWQSSVAVLVDVLGHEGVDTVGTTDANEAIDCMNSGSVDLLIIDPEAIGGTRVLDHARRASGLAVIVVTKHDETATAARAQGFAEIVIKDDHFVGNILDACGWILGTANPAAEETLQCRVLVVDDHPDTVELFSAYLSRHGCDVLQATDGEEALTTLAREPSIQVVLLDVMLPGIGGLDTLAAMARRKVRAGVLMVSALADTEIATRARDLGAFDYLTKPVDLGQLEASIVACAAHAEYSPPF